MKIGIVLQSNDPETAWNAFRFAIASLKSDHKVKVFLLGKGAEVEKIRDNTFRQGVVEEESKQTSLLESLRSC